MNLVRDLMDFFFLFLLSLQRSRVNKLIVPLVKVVTLKEVVPLAVVRKVVLPFTHRCVAPMVSPTRTNVSSGCMHVSTEIRSGLSIPANVVSYYALSLLYSGKL
jgi:hypothetical protein